jgi:hypothetical protein
MESRQGKDAPIGIVTWSQSAVQAETRDDKPVRLSPKNEIERKLLSTQMFPSSKYPKDPGPLGKIRNKERYG